MQQFVQQLGLEMSISIVNCSPLPGGRVASQSELRDRKLVVSGRRERLVRDHRPTVLRVHRAVGVDASDDAGGGLALLFQPHREERLVEEALVVRVDQHRRNVVLGDGGEGEAEDSVDGIVGEERGDGGGLAEGGLRHDERVRVGSELQTNDC